MTRPLAEIIAHIRAVCDNRTVDATLIQTEDLYALCDAAELDRETMVEAIIAAHTDWAMQRMPEADRKEVRAEMDTYRPHAEADVDAIIAALRGES